MHAEKQPEKARLPNNSELQQNMPHCNTQVPVQPQHMRQQSTQTAKVPEHPCETEAGCDAPHLKECAATPPATKTPPYYRRVHKAITHPPMTPE